jgi:hypothetical protein
MVLVLEFMVIVTRHIHLATDDRLDVRILLGHLQELLHTIHVSVVCNGKCGHFQLFRALEKTAYGCLTVKNGVLCVDVKMDE